MLLRVLEPEWHDEAGPLAVGFEDRGKPYESLSFFVASMATPSHALSELAKYKRAKELCGTKNRQPTPTEMYACGYRVSRTPSRLAIEMIRATAPLGADRQVSIKREGDDEIRVDGHLNLRNARFYAQTLAAESTILSWHETFPAGPASR